MLAPNLSGVYPGPAMGKAPDPDERATALADRQAVLGGLAQGIARQGGGAWIPTERVNVPTDDEGGIQRTPRDAIPAAEVELVPEGKRQWVTVIDLEQENAEIERELGEIDVATLGDYTRELLAINGKFAARHIRAALAFLAGTLSRPR